MHGMHKECIKGTCIRRPTVAGMEPTCGRAHDCVLAYSCSRDYPYKWQL